MFDPVEQLGLGGGSRLFVGLAALICFLFGGGTFYKNASFLARAEIVEGRVVGTLPADGSDIQHGRITYQVEYPGPGGPSRYAIQTSTRHKVGGSMVVGYLPSKPHSVREASFRETLLYPICVLIAGTILAVLTTQPLWSRRWRRDHARRTRVPFAEREPRSRRRVGSDTRPGTRPARGVADRDTGPSMSIEITEITEEVFPCPRCGYEVTVKDHASTPCPGCDARWDGIPKEYTAAAETAAVAIPESPLPDDDQHALPIYDPEQAAHFVHGRLPRSTASVDEVLRILDLEAEYQASIGLTEGAAPDGESEPTLDTAEMADWIRREAARQGLPLDGATIAAVLDAELAYLESSGAVACEGD